MKPLRLARALGLVCFVEAGLHMVSVKRLARVLGINVGFDRGRSDNENSVGPKAGDPELALAYRTLRVPDTCLRRALALGFILRRHKPTLRFGSREQDGQLLHHAWLELTNASPRRTPPATAGFRSLGQAERS